MHRTPLLDGGIFRLLYLSLFHMKDTYWGHGKRQEVMLELRESRKFEDILQTPRKPISRMKNNKCQI